MYAQRSNVGRGREHADYATLRQNLKERDCDCRADVPTASMTPTSPASPSCLAAYPLAMVYAPEQAFRSLYECDQWLEKGTIFKELEFPFKGSRKGR